MGRNSNNLGPTDRDPVKRAKEVWLLVYGLCLIINLCFPRAAELGVLNPLMDSQSNVARFLVPIILALYFGLALSQLSLMGSYLAFWVGRNTSRLAWCFLLASLLFNTFVFGCMESRWLVLSAQDVLIAIPSFVAIIYLQAKFFQIISHTYCNKGWIANHRRESHERQIKWLQASRYVEENATNRFQLIELFYWISGLAINLALATAYALMPMEFNLFPALFFSALCALITSFAYGTFVLPAVFFALEFSQSANRKDYYRFLAIILSISFLLTICFLAAGPSINAATVSSFVLMLLVFQATLAAVTYFAVGPLCTAYLLVEAARDLKSLQRAHKDAESLPDTEHSLESTSESLAAQSWDIE